MGLPKPLTVGFQLHDAQMVAERTHGAQIASGLREPQPFLTKGQRLVGAA